MGKDKEKDKKDKVDDKDKDRGPKVGYRGTVAVEEAIAQLSSLCENLRNGALEVEAGDERVLLAPVNPIEMRLVARGGSDEQSLQITLTWNPTPAPKLAFSSPARIDAKRHQG